MNSKCCIKSQLASFATEVVHYSIVSKKRIEGLKFSGSHYGRGCVIIQKEVITQFCVLR